MPTDADQRAHGAGSWWHCLVRGEDGEVSRLIVVESGQHPDEARIELTATEAQVEIGDRAAAAALLGAYGHVETILVADRLSAAAPPMWFAELRESTERPPAVNLVAFSGHGVASGRLLDSAALTGASVASSDQLAALRWYPGTGEVDQIYVQPAWRRQGVSSVLIMAAKTLCAAREWPRLWGDGQRTELGEKMRNAAWWRHRAADLTHVAPPMTPPA